MTDGVIFKSVQFVVLRLGLCCKTNPVAEDAHKIWMLSPEIVVVNSGGVVSSANAVPVNCVIPGVLLSSNKIVKRPPDTVPSRLSAVSLFGGVPPLFSTALQRVPVKYCSLRMVSAVPVTVDG